MKRMTLTALVWLVAFSLAGGDCIAPADEITLIARTIYNDGNLAAPDSVRVIVTLDGTELTDAWYNSADAQCNSANDALVFVDQLQDIDGAGGDGVYSVEIGAYDKDSTLYTWYYHTYTVGIYHAIDLNDVNGTLSDAEIETIDVNVASATTDALELADFNGPTAWWNEGKAGYTLTQAFPANFSTLTIANNSVCTDVRFWEGASVDSSSTGLPEVAFNATERTNLWETPAGTIGSGIGKALRDDHAALPTAAENADAVWDEPCLGHLTPNTFGDSIMQVIENDGVTLGWAAIYADRIAYDAFWGHMFAPSAFDSLGKAIWREANRSLTDNSADSINAILDTLQLWDTRVDSIEAALADVNIGDKVWTDGSFTRREYLDAAISSSSSHSAADVAVAVWDEDITGHYTVGKYGYEATGVVANTWDTTQRDSVLAALKDANVGDKVWTDAGTRNITGGNVATVNSLTPPSNWNTLTIANNSVRADVRYWEGANVDSAASGYPDLSQSEITIADQGITSGDFAAGAIDANAIDTDAIGSNEIATAVIDEIVDAVWDETLNTHTIVGSVGDVLLDSLDAVVSSAGGTVSITDADMAAIADSVWQADTAGHNGTAGSYGKILADESFVQGGTSPPTASQIADAVWDEDAGGHTVSGTYGKYLDTEVSGLGSGSGMYSITVQAYDSSLTESIPNTRLAVRNFDQTALLGLGVTDSQGRTGFNLDADSFLVISIATGYTFAGSDTLIVTGSGVDTVFGDRFDPGTPASPELCRVFGYVVNVQGVSETGATVSAYLPRGVALSGSLVVSPYMVSTQTDSLGYFFLDLIPSDSLTGDDTRYEISISRQDGTVLRKRISVPATSNWQLVW